MKRGFNKKAQGIMGLPFSIIFSLILIIVFIIFAFIAVNHFIDIGKCSQVGQFYDSLQKKVDEAWSSQTSNFDFKADVPSGVTRICFANLSERISNDEDYQLLKNYEIYDANTFIIPVGKACNMPYKLINHINVTRITETRNPYCIDVSRKLKIQKDFYDKWVIIS